MFLSVKKKWLWCSYFWKFCDSFIPVFYRVNKITSGFLAKLITDIPYDALVFVFCTFRPFAIHTYRLLMMFRIRE